MNKLNIFSVFKEIIDNLNWPIVISDTKGRYLYANKIYCIIRGIKIFDIKNKFWWDFISANNEEKFEQARLQQINKEKKYISIVTYFNKKTGYNTIKWDSKVIINNENKETYIIENGLLLEGDSNLLKDKRNRKEELEEVLIDKFNLMLNSISEFGDIINDYLIGNKLKRNIREKIEELFFVKDELISNDNIKKVSVKDKMININLILSEMEDYLVSKTKRIIRVKTNKKIDSYLVFGNYSQIFESLLRLAIIACRWVAKGAEVNISTDLMDNKNEKRLDGIFIKKGRYIEIKINFLRNEDQEKLSNEIFEPFLVSSYVKKNDDKMYEIILPLIYKNIKKYGGFIFIESKTTKMNGFRVLLPAVKSIIGEKEKFKYPDSSREKKASIMIVDYDKGFINYLESILMTIGYSIITADDYKSAMDKYFKSKEKPKLLIIDPFIPINEGILLIKRLKEFNNKMKIVIISKYLKNEFFNQIEDLKF